MSLNLTLCGLDPLAASGEWVKRQCFCISRPFEAADDMCIVVNVIGAMISSEFASLTPTRPPIARLHPSDLATPRPTPYRTCILIFCKNNIFLASVLEVLYWSTC